MYVCFIVYNKFLHVYKVIVYLPPNRPVTIHVISPTHTFLTLIFTFTPTPPF